jgi:hypothetical protein
MNSQQKEAFEAYSLLKAHAELFMRLLEQGTTDDLMAQYIQVKEALDRFAALPQIKKAA